MTLVAGVAIRGCPMLLGDLLLSTQAVPEWRPVLPTTEDLFAPFPPGSDTIPVGMAQKIAVVADNLAVGWAGNMEVARDVISKLRDLSAAGPFTNASLQEHFDSLSPTVWNEKGRFGLVGFVRDNTGIFQFGRNRWSRPTKLFGTVGFVGNPSARHDIQALLDQFDQIPESAEQSLNPLDKSVGFGLALAGAFLRLEIPTGENLKKFYGGGYELAALVGDKFTKIDDIVYLFWTVRIESGAMQIARVPSRVLRFSYVDDLLVIRALSMSDSPDRVLCRETLFLVPPVYRDLRDTEKTSPPKPGFNARLLCNHFLVFAGGQHPEILSMILHKGDDGDRWVRFREFPDSVEVAPEGDFFLRVLSQMEARFGKLEGPGSS